MSGSWKDLVTLTAGARMVVERVRLPERGISLEGAFELPALAQLPADDQVFVVAFVKSHGSIKEMERLFGVSYPTIKARLNRIGAALGEELSIDGPNIDRPGIGIDKLSYEERSLLSRNEILDRLERGEISARDAAEALKR